MKRPRVKSERQQAAVQVQKWSGPHPKGEDKISPEESEKLVRNNWSWYTVRKRPGFHRKELGEDKATAAASHGMRRQRVVAQREILPGIALKRRGITHMRGRKPSVGEPGSCTSVRRRGQATSQKLGIISQVAATRYPNNRPEVRRTQVIWIAPKGAYNASCAESASGVTYGGT